MKIAPVSVIIPTYNREKYLCRALDSVLKQTTKVAEIIVVDDGSEDGTLDVLKSYQQRLGENFFRYIHRGNGGPAAARNCAIALARFPYIAFLDSDDHWHKSKIAKQYSGLVASGLRISHTYEKWLRRGEHLNQKKKHIPRQGDIFTHCLQLCAVGMSTVMVERALFADFGLFDESMRCCEDYDFWIRVSCQTTFHLVEERLTIKEGGREDQVSYQYRVGMDRLRIDALQRLLCSGVLRKDQWLQGAMELVRKAEIFGQGCLRHGQKQLGEQYLGLAQQYRANTSTV